MEVYCADAGTFILKVCRQYENLPKFNILYSYYYFKKYYGEYFKYAKNIIVDSGAFTLQQEKNKTDYDKYFKEYLAFIKKTHKNDQIKGYFEYDIDSVVSYEKMIEYRNQLFEVTDKIIPVWHKHQGVEEYKKMVKEYNWIGISCVNDRSIPKNKYGMFVNYAHKNNCKIHGLGMLREDILNKVPFDTVDGTSWFRSARFGRHKNKKIKSEYISSNQLKLTYMELIKHIKFQERMYRKWKWYHND